MKPSSKTQKQGQTHGVARRKVSFDVFQLYYIKILRNEVACLETKFFCVAQQPKSGLGGMTVDVSRSHTTTHIHTCTQSVGLPCTSDQLVLQTATCTARNKHKRGAPMPSAGFEPAIPARERPQTHALDRAATGSAL